MMNQFQPPPSLDLSGNVASNWKKFRQRFELYLEANDKTTATDKTKNAILLTVAGNEALDVYNTFVFVDADKVLGADQQPTEVIKLSAVLAKFETYCSPKQNETYERYIFRSRMQKQFEPMDKFITDLKTRAKTCNFNALQESLIRDQIVVGVYESRLKERLLREPDLTLARAEQICNAAEAVHRQLKTLTSPADNVEKGKTVDVVRKRSNRTSLSVNRPSLSGSAGKNVFDCRNCGTRHQARKCPAYQTKCSKCQRFNHFPSCCRTVKIETVYRNSEDVNDTEETFSEEEFVITVVESQISDNANASTAWITKVSVNNCSLSLKVDTGAQINVIRHKDLLLMNPRPKMLQSTVALTSYQGTQIPCMGLCKLSIHSVNGDIPAFFAIVPDQFQSILGLSTAMDMGILDIPGCDRYTKHKLVVNSIQTSETDTRKIGLRRTDSGQTDDQGTKTDNNKTESGEGETLGQDCEGSQQTGKVDTKFSSRIFGPDIKQEILQKYPQLFEGIGKFGDPYKIQLKDNYTPVIIPVRHVPFVKKKMLKAELDRMESLGVISRIDKPTEFVNSLVLTTKDNGEIRCCLDPRGLNKCIQRERYHIKTREEIFSELAGAKFFTQIDLKSAFWQIPLEEESKAYTAFGTPFGRYAYNVLPFGVNSGSEICQKRIETHIVKDLVALGHQDNILTFGRHVLEHDIRAEALLDQVVASGATLNLEKCEFRVTETKFLGEILTENGIKPDPTKIQAIQDMQAPCNVKELQALLGLVNFFSKFIPNLSAKTAALRSLLTKRSTWTWDSNHDLELSSIKSELTSAPVLTLFDPAKTHKVSTDSSINGLGAVLLQMEDNDWHPVAYGSRSMHQSECDYIQIEKEALALAFGVTKFESYVYGKHFVVETDNRPLATIFNRGLAHAPFRIQALMLKLQKFDFEVVWVPRKFIKGADALSKIAKPRETDIREDPVTSVHVDTIINDMPISADIWDEIKRGTIQDPVLVNVMASLKKGDRLPGNFNHFVHELSVIDNVLFRNQQIVVPSGMRQEMLNRIHEGHLGITKCKNRARQSLYWPGMSRDIEDMTKQCDLCMKYQYKNPSQPLTQEHQDKPWHKVATDIFTLGGKDYLLTIDYFSNYPEISPLESKSAKAVICALKSIFSRHGIPVEVTSDNVPFSSQDFLEFAKYYGFDFVPISPRHSNSNGKAEKGVQVVKRILKKCWEKEEDAYLAILNYRNSPLECGRSPAQLLMNRELRTRLPQAFIQQTPQAEEVMDKIKKSRADQKFHYDKTTRQLKPLQQGEVVRIYSQQEGNYPQRGVILNKHSHNSYNVRTETGRTLRRNRDHLKHTLEQYSPNVDIEEQEHSRDSLPSESAMKDVEEHTGVETEHIPVGADGNDVQASTHVDIPRHEVLTDIQETSSGKRPVRTRHKPRRLIEED